jgi:hypothetical protein
MEFAGKTGNELVPPHHGPRILGAFRSPRIGVISQYRDAQEWHYLPDVYMISSRPLPLRADLERLRFGLEIGIEWAYTVIEQPGGVVTRPA